MRVFFSKAEIVPNVPIELDEEESRHLGKALRIRNGEKVLATDGKGYIYNATVEQAEARSILLRVSDRSDLYTPPAYYIHIALAPTKNIDRVEWFVEKAVEHGVDEISFVQTERSERKNVNTDRLYRVAISAMKQSLKGKLPLINDLQKLSSFFKRDWNEYECYIGHLEEGDRRSLFREAAVNGRYLVLIGPEGDFSPGELAISQEKRFQSITLGDYRLRTETAALAACHILNIKNQL